MKMKKVIFFMFAASLLCGCGEGEKELRKQAEELCRYIPVNGDKDWPREYMTEDFYSLLDTLKCLPNHEAMDHEWEHYFIGDEYFLLANKRVLEVQRIDKMKAEAVVGISERRTDDIWDLEHETGPHYMEMTKVDGRWLISDYDGHKADCKRYIANNREEQRVRRAICDYLVREMGDNYSKGTLCIPTLMIVKEEKEKGNDNVLLVWGDFWVLWYNVAGDTLKCVSGGNHSGLMTLEKGDGEYKVVAMEQTVDGAGNVASAKRIFGEHYDVYKNMHSNKDVREAVRKEQLSEYVKRHGLSINYYQDYGWPAVKISE